MTLRPIPGAPTGAPIPDFPTGNPSPLVAPAPRFTRRPAEPFPFAFTPPPPEPSSLPARRPGPVEIRGNGNSILTFRCLPEIPAIGRSSMTISIVGEPAGDFPHGMRPHLDLSTDKAKAFLRALRDGASPVVMADNRNEFQVEFVIAQDGPTFIVSMLGREGGAQRFNAEPTYDVKSMAADLLADLGP
jgi:hypothetical protein